MPYPSVNVEWIFFIPSKVIDRKPQFKSKKGHNSVDFFRMTSIFELDLYLMIKIANKMATLVKHFNSLIYHPISFNFHVCIRYTLKLVYGFCQMNINQGGHQMAATCLFALVSNGYVMTSNTIAMCW